VDARPELGILGRMERRALGRTGMEVSILGFGGSEIWAARSTPG
jgi:hypothetical protein